MPDDRKSLIPEDDYEYEKEIAKKEQAERELSEEELERSAEEQQRLHELERKQYEKELQDKKIELVKLKQGVVESSDTIKEERHEKVRLSFSQWIENVWYRSKWIIIFAFVVIVAIGYIVYDSAVRIKPDLTVLAVMDNSAIYARTTEFQSFIESYCEDLNGDGKVNVLIYNISTDYSDPNTVTSYQAQLMTQLQLGENMIIISDGTTDFAVHDFTSELEGECVTPLGIRLNCELTREALKWEAMPDELYIGLREPTRLLSTSEEEMRENYNEALPTYLRIYEAIRQSCEDESAAGDTAE